MKNLLILFALVCLSSAYLVEFSHTYFGKVAETNNGNNNFSITTLARAPVQQSFTYNDPLYGVISGTQLIDIPDREAFWHSYFNQVDNLWTEVGNITFGFFGPNYQAHRIHFTVASFSRIDSWHEYRNGAGYANITGGEGFFKGADGRFAWISTYDSQNQEWVARVSGVFWVPAGPPPPPPTRSPLFSTLDMNEKKIHF
eukprot:Phypoly_transcript_19096.p1 GENE.Phypoly_transcript_19096~~Phypoly_transcript_19096.p1  ORF type:complete len:199 (-),score=39.37 Phypoly_transcript_19096:89-685(-)